MLKWCVKAALVAFGVQLAFFAWVKIFSVDELTYLHGAWLITKGFVPFRDFDLPHHFLICYLQSWLFLLLPEGVLPILFSRIFMWTLFLSVALFAFYMSGKNDFLRTGLSFLFMAASPLFVKHIVEVRPDSLSFLFFLVGFITFWKKYFSPPIRVGIVGVSLCFSFLACIKVVAYGFPLFFFLMADLLSLKPQGGLNLYEKPRKYFLFSTCGMLLLSVIWLSLTGSWDGLINHCNQAFRFVFYFKKSPWVGDFVFTVRENLWIFLLALTGFIVYVKKIWALGWRLEKNGALLNSTWLFALLSYAIQSRPFSYSFLPFWGVAAFLATSGMQWLFLERSVRVRAIGGILLVVGFSFSFARNQKFFEARLNSYQREIWGIIASLTNEGDAIFDNVGGFVFRPDTARHFSRSFYHIFTNRSELLDFVPEQIENSKCVAWMYDYRASSLPKTIQSYLFNNFIPYNEDLAFWGKRYYLKGHANELQFKAVKSDSYFIAPETILNQAQVWVNGQKLKEPVFKLEEGIHQIRISGPVKEVVVAWLPRNGKRFTPLYTLNPKFYKS